MGSKRYSELCTQYIMDLFKVRDKTVFESVGLKFVGYVNSVRQGILRVPVDVELRRHLR